ncbi:MAG: hypothetical protein BWK80_52965 [Desulfobacteraceae bacterium IS3]|nr:MAG: hypothetical protein BWK80_52965 [Desulfobacteraceae bacterium IS3]
MGQKRSHREEQGEINEAVIVDSRFAAALRNFPGKTAILGGKSIAGVFGRRGENLNKPNNEISGHGDSPHGGHVALCPPCRLGAASVSDV